jgi:hypothetical protein
VRTEAATGIDWREPAAYAPLLDSDRSLFAWEWLRRDPAYCQAAWRALSAGVPSVCAGAQPRDFGLVAFEPPHLAVPAARPLWRSDFTPFVLAAEPADRAAPADRFRVDPAQKLARMLRQDEHEHLLISDGLRMIRIDAPAGTFGAEPRGLRYSITGIASAGPALLTLRRFLVFCRTGRFSRRLHAREARARRWILLLRTGDALATGANQRDIAEVLLSSSVRAPRWRSRESSVRSQAQRLVSSARRLAGGGYRELAM